MRYNGEGDFFESLLAERISEFTKQIRNNPNDAEAYLNRGLIYGLKNKEYSAINDFNKAIELNPECGEAFNQKAISEFRLEKYDESLNDMKKAESLGFDMSHIQLMHFIHCFLV